MGGKKLNVFQRLSQSFLSLYSGCFRACLLSTFHRRLPHQHPLRSRHHPHPISNLLWKTRARQPQAGNTSCILRKGNKQTKKRKKNFHAPTIAINERAECNSEFRPPRPPTHSDRILAQPNQAGDATKAAASLRLIIIDRYPRNRCGARAESQQAQISPSPLVCLPCETLFSQLEKAKQREENTDRERGGGGGDEEEEEEERFFGDGLS